MKQLVFLLGKIFILASIAFGFLTMLMFGIMPSSLARILVLGTNSDPVYLSMRGINVGYFLGLGVMYGALMALILGFWHYFAVLRIAKGKPLDLSPLQHRIFVLSSPPTTVFDYSMQFLQSIDARIIECNPLENHITARTKTSWWMPWGDNIRIDVIPTSGKETHVQITSRPVWKTALVDFGSSYRNVEEFITAMNRMAA